MKTRGGWREAPQAHEIAVKTAGQMTDEDVEARIRAFDQQIGTLIGDQPDPVAWTEGLVSIAKARLSEPAVQPTFATMAHSEIDDLHWAILAGISQRSSQPFRGTPLRQFKPV